MLPVTLLSIFALHSTYPALLDASPLTRSSPRNPTREETIVQQNLAAFPPVPIFKISSQHILGQIGLNATPAGNISLGTIVTDPHRTNTYSECSRSKPCADGSCCNSDGKCGFMDYHCKNTKLVTCVDNCNAIADCGINSRDGTQKCPLNLCCSSYGYCGTTELYCGKDGSGATPSCQRGFGSCSVVSPPGCNVGCKTASNGRRLAYYQASNLLYRACNPMEPEHIHTNGLSHLVFAFASIDPQTFEIVPAFSHDALLYSRFTNLKSSALQTWIGIGGGTFNDPGPTSRTFSELCASAEKRTIFISSMVKFMLRYGFQGVDIDWEYPSAPERGGSSGDAKNFVTLVKEMRAVFKSRFGISTILPSDFYYLGGFDPIGLQPFVDFFNFMAYDLHGPWEANAAGTVIRAQTSIIDIATDMTPLWFDLLDPSKINLGIANYGRGYTVSDMRCRKIGCPWTKASKAGPCTNSEGVMSLREIETLIQQKHLTPRLIAGEMVKEVTFDDQWIGYDDEETITLKTTWANQHCLGGTAIWSIDLS